MTELHPQFLTEPNGKRLSVLLPLVEYEALIKRLEDLEDAREAEAICRRVDSGEEPVITLEEHLRDGLAC